MASSTYAGLHRRNNQIMCHETYPDVDFNSPQNYVQVGLYSKWKLNLIPNRHLVLFQTGGPQGTEQWSIDATRTKKPSDPMKIVRRRLSPEKVLPSSRVRAWKWNHLSCSWATAPNLRVSACVLMSSKSCTVHILVNKKRQSIPRPKPVPGKPHDVTCLPNENRTSSIAISMSWPGPLM